MRSLRFSPVTLLYLLATSAVLFYLFILSSNHSLFLGARYFDGDDSVVQFRLSLIDNIVVNLLWQDFMLFSGSKDEKREISGMSVDLSEDNNPYFLKKTVETMNIKHPMSYTHELGKCIIGILSGMYLLEHNLLSSFCVAFQDDCLQVFKPEETQKDLQGI